MTATSFAELRFRLRSLRRRSRVERELAAELSHHAAVHGRFPEAEAIAEACWDSRGIGRIEALFRDLRYAGRRLRRSPGFTVPAVLTLALGMGAAVAIFSVADAISIQPLA